MDFMPGDPKIKNFLKAWAPLEQKLMAQVGQVSQQPSAAVYLQSVPAVKEVIRVLTMLSEGQNPISALIISCSTLYTATDFQRLGDLSKLPSFDDDAKPSDLCFIYDYLYRCAVQSALQTEAEQKANAQRASPLTVVPVAAPTSPVPSNKVLHILHSVRSKLMTLTQQLKMNPMVAETTLSALLFLTRRFASVVSSFFLDTHSLYLSPTHHSRMINAHHISLIADIDSRSHLFEISHLIAATILPVASALLVAMP